MNLEEMKTYLEEKGYTSRGCRFKVIEELMGISPADAKKIETITRYIRAILPPDETGAIKEKEKVKELGYGSQQTEIFKQETKKRYDMLTGEKINLI